MQRKLLLILPLPPPVHGSNLINQQVANCNRLYKPYQVKIIPLHYITNINEIGTINPTKLFRFVKYLITVTYNMAIFRPEVIYFVPALTGVSFLRDCFFALLFKYFKIHVVYHLHGKGIRNKLKSPLFFRLYSWFFKNATIIQLSKLLHYDIKDVVSNKQCKFLPNGIDPGSLIHIPVRKFNNKPVILFFSNLMLSKGPIVLLQACRFLANKGFEFKTIFAGNPSRSVTREFFLKTIKRMNLQNYVKYLGPLYKEEKYNVFRESDIFVFPTFYKYEAFPLVLLEAMAASLPVISTSEGAIPEIVDDGITGFIVEKQNPAQLAEKIEYLITHPELARKMGQAGRLKFERQYTIEIFYQNLLQLFNEIFESLGNHVE